MSRLLRHWWPYAALGAFGGTIQEAAHVDTWAVYALTIVAFVFGKLDGRWNKP